MKHILSALLSFTALISPAYTPPDNGNPDTERGTGTRFQATANIAVKAIRRAVK
jgi:hypothetical protein